MNKKTFFLLTFASLVCTGAWSQKVTISGKGLSLEKVFEMIKAQTGYDFVYNQDDIDQAKKVDLQVKNAPLEEVLDRCLRPQGFTYEIRNRIIGIRRPAVKKPAPNHVSVTGLVVDTTAGDKPLSDASIVIKGSQTGVRTGRDGRFTLEDIDPHAILLVSYVGYRPREMTIGVDAGYLYVPLEPGDSKLDEVQTIAYGKVSNRFNTGNVTTVKGSDIVIQPVGNPLLALQGLVPGLAITQLTGAPGGGIRVQLRGKGSLLSNTEPFYVIDGIPYDPRLSGSLLTGFNGNLAGGSILNMINPYDIESIDVLKDADATAIYGSQGANGIILITTKKGRPGPGRLTLDAYSGWGTATTIPNYLGLDSYLAMRHEALSNDKATVARTDYDINGKWDTTRYTNWSKLLLGKMVRANNLQAQFTGGNKDVQYFVGAGFRDESTVFPSTGEDKKSSIHLNVNARTPDKKLEVQLTGSWLSGVNDVQSAQIVQSTAAAADAPPAYNADHSLNWQNETYHNPLAPLTVRYNNHSHTVIGSALLTYHAIRGLDLKANVGYNELYNREFSGTPSTTTDPSIFAYIDPSNFRHSAFLHDDSRSWTIEPQISFTRPMGNGILTALAGGSYRHNWEKAGGNFALGFSSDSLLIDLSKAKTVDPLGERQDDYKYNAVFGRLNYNWKNRYLASLNGRYDGSSRFGPDRQFHFFGSFAVAWIFTAESFFQRRLPWLSFGKLRGSYGSTGLDDIQGFLAQGTYDSTFHPYQGSYGLQPHSLANPDISWESTRKLEIGLDLGFGKDRFLFNANYYRFRTSNLLQYSQLSVVTGLPDVEQNLPVVVGNQGFEMSVQTTNIKTPHFTWTTSATLTIPRNKLIRYDHLAQSSEQGILTIGYPLNSQRLFRSGGVDPQTGLYRFIDSAGNYTQNPLYLGNLTAVVRMDPTLYGSVGNRLQYRSFTLDILFFFKRQENINPDLSTPLPPGYEGNNVLEHTAKKHWRYPGETAAVQRYGNGYKTLRAYFTATTSDLYYANAAFIRCKNVYLAYQIPATLTRKMRIENFTCYLMGENLFTISPYKDLDPETGTNLAPVRLVAGGIKLIL